MWPDRPNRSDYKDVVGEAVSIPFGSALILRSDALHAGGFAEGFSVRVHKA